MNYFKLLCFIWAAIGLVSRIIMGMMGPKWKDWELGHAYKDKKPPVINLIAITGYMVVLFTWYRVLTDKIPFSWIIALLLSSIVIKVSTLLFRYEAFRAFAVKTLNDSKKMRQLNISVLIFSLTLVLMGIYLY